MSRMEIGMSPPISQLQLVPSHLQVAVEVVHVSPADEQLGWFAMSSGQSVSPHPAKMPAPTASTDASIIRVIVRMRRHEAGAVPDDGSRS